MDRLSASDLLTLAREAGFTVHADRGRLRLTGPKGADALAQRLLARKAELLALLGGGGVRSEGSGGEGEDRQDAEAAGAERERPSRSGDADDAAADQARRRWSEVERRLAGRMAPANVRTVNLIKDVFPDAVVESVEAEDCRVEAALLIRSARRRDLGQAVNLRDAWRERLAVCTVDGGMSEGEAQRLAIEELRGMVGAKG